MGATERERAPSAIRIVAIILALALDVVAAPRDAGDPWALAFADRLADAGIRSAVSFGFGVNAFSHYDPALADLAYGIESDSLEASLALATRLLVLPRGDSLVALALGRWSGGNVLIRPEDIALVAEAVGADAVIVGQVLGDSLFLVRAVRVEPPVPLLSLWLSRNQATRSFHPIPEKNVPSELLADELRETVPYLLHAREWRRAQQASQSLLERAPDDELARYWAGRARSRGRPDEFTEDRLAIARHLDADRPDLASRDLDALRRVAGGDTPEIERWAARVNMNRDLLAERLRRSVRRSMDEQEWMRAGQTASSLAVLEPNNEEVRRWREQIAVHLEIRVRSLRFATEMDRGGPMLGAERRGALEVEGGGKGEDVGLEQLALPVAMAVTPGERNQESIDLEMARTRGVIRGCYALALVENPSLAGVVVVEFSIQPTGSVTDARVAQSSLGIQSVEECVVGVVNTWTFPPTTTTETFTLTFAFQPR